jgi:hypothetical protein
MNKSRSTTTTLADRLERFVLEHLPAPLQLRRVQLISQQEELVRSAEVAHKLGAELAAWREWSTRLVLAERWARCAAEHERGSHWRVLLSAYAVAALLTDDLGELEIDLTERSKAAEQFGDDPSTGEKVATPAQQVGVVFRAILEELIAAKKAETRHYYDPVTVDGRPPQAELHRIWDRQKLATGARDLVISATNQAITIATTRLGPATQATSPTEV